jgi:4'-phosphopantetheinyl transferase
MIPRETSRDASRASSKLSLSAVQVWRVFLDRIPGDVGGPGEILSPDEEERANRFYFERDRRRFTVARGALRAILGGYLRVDAKSIRFDYGPQGKPRLASATSGIQFNVAHSGELALIAVARERELGIDIELVRPLNSANQIAESFFSPREVAALQSLSRHLAKEAFFACWTRKEAYIKARGGGLSIPLAGFDVSLEPGEPAALLAVRDDPDEVSRWGMVELHPAPGYKGALVAQGKDWHVQSCDWTGNLRQDCEDRARAPKSGDGLAERNETGKSGNSISHARTACLLSVSVSD